MLMSKKRRTKKEKILATSRHDFSQALSYSPINIQEVISTPKLSENKVTQSKVETYNYSYVAKDMRSTAMITLILIAIDIVLFFVLKLGIVNLKGITF